MRVTRFVLLALLATAVVAGTVAPAMANTELVPGSRLVFPYVDIQSGRETFLLLTNAGSNFTPVHIEFYSQSCLRTDRRIDLTGKDIAAVVVSTQVTTTNLPAVSGSVVAQNVAGIGWADVDARNPIGCASPSNLANCNSVEYNGLMGTAVVVDVTADWAFAYPAAASQGSSSSGFTTTSTTIGGNTVTVPTGTILTRDPSGFALTWTGAYETYPDTHLIPAFIAEDICTSTAFRAFISLVGPADAWRKEGPGAPLGTSTLLVQLNNSSAFDGAENAVSVNAEAHQVNGRLCDVFQGSTAARTAYHNPPGYASFDIQNGPNGTSTNAVGWLELSNNILVPLSSTTGPAPNINFTSTAGFDTSQRHRGMVGLVFEIQSNDGCLGLAGCTSGIRLFTADAVRSWADPASQFDWGCFNTSGGTGAGGGIRPTIVNGSNQPTCAASALGGSGAVTPSWLGDHAQSLVGGKGVSFRIGHP